MQKKQTYGVAKFLVWLAIATIVFSVGVCQNWPSKESVIAIVVFYFVLTTTFSLLLFNRVTISEHSVQLRYALPFKQNVNIAMDLIEEVDLSVDGINFTVGQIRFVTKNGKKLPITLLCSKATLEELEGRFLKENVFVRRIGVW